MKLWLGTYFSSILSLSCFELKESFFILYKQVQTLIINARRMNTFFVTKDQDLMVFVLSQTIPLNFGYLELIVLTRVNFSFVPYGRYYEIALA